MKATHKLTYLPSGGVYLFHVHGDNYYIVNSVRSESGPFSGFGFVYKDNDKWLVEKIGPFKGNK